MSVLDLARRSRVTGLLLALITILVLVFAWRCLDGKQGDATFDPSVLWFSCPNCHI
jgi:hypothetical protein